MSQSQKAVLVAEERDDDHGEEVVVDVGVLRMLTPVPDVAKDKDSPDCIVLADVVQVVVLEGVVNNEENDGHEDEEDDPEDWWPVLHHLPVKHELLHDSFVHMGKLETNEEADEPDVEVVVKHLMHGVSGTWIDDWAILIALLSTVAMQVLVGSQHDNSRPEGTERTNLRNGSPEALGVAMLVPEEVLSLIAQVDDIDISVANDQGNHVEGESSERHIRGVESITSVVCFHQHIRH